MEKLNLIKLKKRGEIMKKIFLFAIILGIMGIIFADISVSNVVQNPSIIRPGTKGTITMTITNTANIQISTLTADYEGIGPISAYGRQVLGDYYPSTSTYFTIPFSVNDNASAGSYFINVKFTYSNSTRNIVKTVQIPIAIRNDPIFIITSEDERIYTEGEFYLKLKLKNIGQEVKNIKLEVLSDELYQLKTNKIAIPSLEKNQEVNLSIKLSADQLKASGLYTIPIKISYLSDTGNEESVIENIKLNIMKKNPDISLELGEEQILVPGAINQITLKVKNNGEKKAYSVRVGQDTSDILTILEKNYYELGDIEPNAYKTVELKVGIKDVKPGYYIEKFLIKTKDENGDEKSPLVYNLGLDIQAKPELGVFLSAKPAPLVENSEHTLTLLVSNIGISEIKSLTASVQSDAFEVQDIQNEQYIGSLTADDFSSVQFKIKTKPKTGTYPVKVILKFLDNKNKQQTITKELTVNILNQNQVNGNNKFNPMFIGIGIVVLVIAFLVYWFKFRKTDKHAKAT